MKVCIVSDSHDNRSLLGAAVKQGLEWGAEAVIHCGDVVAPSTLNVLQPFGLPIHVIHGNNTGDLYMMARIAAKEDSLIQFYGQDAGLTLAGRRIFVVHYPHYARAMATTGEWDIVCCGHDHRADIRPIKNMNNETTMLVNPGTSAGIGAKPTFIMADLHNMAFTIHEIQAAD